MKGRGLGGHMDGRPVVTDAGREYVARHRAGLCGGCRRTQQGEGRLGASGYRGVYWRADRARWIARFERRHLGQYTLADDAARAYDAAALRLIGPTARLNFPQPIEGAASAA